MPLLHITHESLPYIDAEPSAHARSAASLLINAELSSTCTTTSEPHPSLAPLAPSNLTPLMTAEIARISSSNPPPKLSSIDLSRYESLSIPDSTTSPLNEAQTILQKAHTSSTYLTHRNTNLSLLHTHGKNAWLVGNSQLEDILRGLEREVAERKDEIDGVVLGRKNAQESVQAEIQGLEEGWKKGVGRVLETEVAAEGVRREILEARRNGAK